MNETIPKICKTCVSWSCEGGGDCCLYGNWGYRIPGDHTCESWEYYGIGPRESTVKHPWVDIILEVRNQDAKDYEDRITKLPRHRFHDDDHQTRMLDRGHFVVGRLDRILDKIEGISPDDSTV